MNQSILIDDIEIPTYLICSIRAMNAFENLKNKQTK